MRRRVMTEEEAKTKWCPHVRAMATFGDQFAGTYNRSIHDDLPNPACIASDCMMWRWIMSPRDAAEINSRGDAGAVPSGHCGLAK